MNNSSGASGGCGMATVLFLIFLVLKLTGTINWSWWWVTSPLWISAGAFLILLVTLFILAVAIKKYLERGL